MLRCCWLNVSERRTGLTHYQVIPSPFQAGGSPFTPQDSLSSTSGAVKLPGLMLAGGEEVVVEDDVHRGLPQAGSHFPSNSITDFPSERAAQRAAKQLLVHLFTSLPSFPSLPKVPPKAVPNHQAGGWAPRLLPALERCGTCSGLSHTPNCLDANVNRRTKTGSASLAAARQEHCQALCPK